MARVEITTKPDGHLDIRVVLSRRNLLALLHKLDWEGSQREIHNNDVWLDGEQAPIGTVPEGPGYLLILNCEDNMEHYERRNLLDLLGGGLGHNPPGMMHPDTEEFIQAHHE